MLGVSALTFVTGLVTFASLVEVANSRNQLGLSNSKQVINPPKIDPSVLWSIKSQIAQRKTTQKYYVVKVNVENIYNDCMKKLEGGCPPGIVMRVASKYGVQPAMLAKTILQHHISISNSNEKLALCAHDTTLINNKYLAHEILLCNITDCTYGPISSIVRSCIGKEHELLLENYLKEKGIPFSTESDLRKKGYDKTPDILLDMPIAVDSFVIHWIEGKALFADAKTHNKYANDQYMCYFNRYGTGLVIYWSGFVKSITQLKEYENKFLVKEKIPEIVPFNPDLIPA